MYKCKICGKKYTDINTLYNHIEQKHGDMIPKDMSVEQYYYFMKTGKRNGNCVMCKQMTTWNKNTHKYNRFCGNPRCKEKYVEIVKGRMIAKYGKVHLLNDPNKQREMLANRKISGKYQWSGSHVETTYTGSYELDFLKTLDIFFDWDPEDISMPSPHTYTYEYEGEQKFYIPDAFIHSLDLEIEIKDGGDNPNNHYKIQAVDKEKERLKDEVMKSQKMFHYVKLTNKNYANFFDFLKEVKDGFEKYGDDKKIPRIFKTEDIRTKSIVQESYDVLEEGMIKNKINALNKRPYAQNMDFLEMSYELRKNDYDKLQHYFLTLAKNFNYEEDLSTIKYFIKKTFDHYNKVIVNNPDLEKEYYNFKKWVNKPLTYEVKDRLRDIKENYIYESSISLAYINNCLQNEYDELLRQYLQDYTDFYHRMLKERPDTVPHINDDIKRAIVFIDGLSKKGNVSNDLLKSAKWCLGDLVNLNKHTKPIKHSNHTQSLKGYSIKTEAFNPVPNCNIWVGADWHFYTKYNDKLKENPNIDKIIRNFNKKIKKGDIVVFVGDLYDARRIYDKKEMSKLDNIKKLNGHKIFVKGNHDVDPDQAYYDLGFDLVCTRHEIGNLVFTHEPVDVNENQINIHGHLHYCRDYWYIKPKSHIDVYTARFNYQPLNVKDAVLKYNDGVMKPLALNTFNELFDVSVINESSEIEVNNNSILKVKVLYNPESRNIFTLNDKSSQIIINEHYVIQRDINGSNCSITQGQCDETNRKILEFDVVFNDNINVDVLIKEKMETGVQINSLFNPNDMENRFIREMSLKLFGLYPNRCELYR